jgi:putative SOS response-associated peptidase YedK
MPVIVPKDKETLWLVPDNHHQKELLSLLKPYPSDKMQISDVDAKTFQGPKG